MTTIIRKIILPQKTFCNKKFLRQASASLTVWLAAAALSASSFSAPAVLPVTTTAPLLHVTILDSKGVLAAPVTPMAGLSLSPHFDFGSINPMQTARLEHVFLLRNDTAVPLTLRRLQTSCDCTTAVLADARTGATLPLPWTLAPRGWARLPISVDLDRLAPGPFDKTVALYVQGQEAPVGTAVLSGTLVPRDTQVARGALVLPPQGFTQEPSNQEHLKFIDHLANNIPTMYAVTTLINNVDFGYGPFGYEGRLEDSLLTPLGKPINNYGQVIRGLSLWTPLTPNGTIGVMLTNPILIPDSGKIALNDAGQYANDYGIWSPSQPNGIVGQITTIWNISSVDALIESIFGTSQINVNNNFYTGFEITGLNNYGQASAANPASVNYSIDQDYWTDTVGLTLSGSQVSQFPPLFNISQPIINYTDPSIRGNLFAIPLSINDSGVAVGYSYVGNFPGVGEVYHATMWSNGTTTDLGTLGSSQSYSCALQINQLGQVVGYSSTPPFASNGASLEQAFVYSNGAMINLGAILGAYQSVATGINDQGQVVGYYASSPPTGYPVVPASAFGSNIHGFIWDPVNGAQNLEGRMSSCGSGKEPTVFPYGINNAGQIVATVYYGTYTMDLLTPLNRFRVTDLGTLGGNTSAAYSINSQGQVVGYSTTLAGARHAFLWAPASGGTVPAMQDLLALPGGTESVAYAINDNSQIVGASYNSTQQPTAFIDSTGAMTALSTLGGSGAAAYAINWNGQLTGQAENAAEDIHAVTSTGSGSLSDLGTLPGGSYSVGFGINGFGQVAGEADTASGRTHAVFYSGGKLTDLGILPGGSYSSASDINDWQCVTGEADTSGGDTHAFIYVNGAMIDLGALPSSSSQYSTAQGFNNNCSIVGTSYTDNGYHAFIALGQNMVDLNTMIPSTSGWTLESATAINDSTQVVGMGLYNGQQHAFLLTPSL